MSTNGEGDRTAAGSMRIVHITQPTTAGTAVTVGKLAEAGLRAGHHVTVACPDDGDLPRWTREVGACWYPLPLSRSPDPQDLRAMLACHRLARGADVLHLHSSKAAALGRLAVAGMRHRPFTIVNPHGWSWYVGGRAAPLYRGFERLAARWADVLVAVSRGECADGAAVLGPHGDKIRVIENGVDLTAYTPEGPSAPRSDDPLVVCVGRLSEQKGQDLAVRALALLPDQRTRLRLVGDGPYEPVVRRAARAAGVELRVEFVGRTDPRPHLRAADVVLVSSRWEGMSLLLLEAMACGAAIVSTDTAGADALGDAGVVVPLTAAPASLARALTDLLADPRRRRALGSAARSRAMREYDLASVLAEYQRLWESARLAR